MYENKKVCERCGGQCCKNYPGTVYPEDIGYSIKKVREMLSSGRYALDWWEGDPRQGKMRLSRAYFLRPATKIAEGKVLDPSWGGECTFLTSSGCSLSPDDRPKQCRELEPREEGNCEMHNGCTKQDGAIKWLSMRRGILRIVKGLKNE